jgi:hypothetical protein
LDLFVPHEEGYAFKVIVTNKQIKAKKVLMFHNGRADQEGLFGELKSQVQMDYIPVRRLGGNQFYNLAAILAHNLTREIQMMARRERAAEYARCPETVTVLRAGTAKCVLLPDLSDDGQASDCFPGAAGKVTPDQVRVAASAKPEHAVKEAVQPIHVVAAAEGHGAEAVKRRAAHCGDVAEVAGQELAADLPGRCRGGAFFEKVAALDDLIHGDEQQVSVVHAKPGAVIPRRDDKLARRDGHPLEQCL